MQPLTRSETRSWDQLERANAVVLGPLSYVVVVCSSRPSPEIKEYLSFCHYRSEYRRQREIEWHRLKVIAAACAMLVVGVALEIVKHWRHM